MQTLLALLAVPALTQAAPSVQPASFGQLFASTGFVGPLMLLAGILGLVLTVRRWLELRPGRLAPAELERELETHVHAGRIEDGLARATESRTVLGEFVAAGLLLRKAGLDEMLANVERAAGRTLLRLENDIANLARLGGLVLLAGLFGSILSLMSALVVLMNLAEPSIVPAGASPGGAIRLGDFVRAIGEALPCVALGLFVALGCFVAFFLLDASATRRTLAVREVAEDLMRDAAERSA